LGNSVEGIPIIVRPFFADIDSLGLDEGRRILDLNGFSGVKDLSPLCRLKQLTSLDISGMTSVMDISALNGLVELRRLKLAGCTGISDIGPLSMLRNLTELDLSA
jgi:internalin A